MTSPFSDELISAYLDGELTVQEQAYVEEQLRENADLRRMCDELRALRATLQAMPVAEPPANFAERILRQAERRMLLDDVSMTESSFMVAAQERSSGGRRHRVFVLRDWRVGVTVAAALAACVLVMLWIPPRAQEIRNVALAPETTLAVPAAVEQPVEGRVEERVVDLDTSRSVQDRMVLAPATANLAMQDGASASRAAPDLARRSAAIRLAAPVSAQPAPAAPKPAPPPENVAGRDGSPNGFGGGMVGDGPAGALAGGMPGGGGGMMSGGPAGASAGGFPGGVAGDRGMMGGQIGSSGSVAPEGLGGAAKAAASEPMSEPMTAAAPRVSEPAILGPTSSGMGLTAEGKTGPPGAGAARGGLERFGDEANAGTPVTGPLIDQLVSQLDTTQMLFVKVQLPQHELAASLAELRKSVRVNQLSDAGTVQARDLYEYRFLDIDALSQAMAQKDKSAAGPVALEFNQRDGGPNQNVFVVHGSADQIRQSLANLVATPDVAVETAPAEFTTRFFRSLEPSFRLKEDPTDSLDAERQSGGDVASTLVEKNFAMDDNAKEGVAKGTAQADPAGPESLPKRSKQLTEPAGVRSDAASAVPAADSKRSDMADERSPSRAESAAAPADRARGTTEDSPTRERQDEAENRTIIYILFRLPKE
ncbi:MAG: anti-sigma factor family protein [Pirellulaceae bacterium]